MTTSANSTIDRFGELEHLYHTAPVGLCLLDRQLRHLRINERLASINGCAVEAHIGRTVREVIPNLADAVEPVCRRVIETGTSVLDFEVAGTTPADPGVRRHWLFSYHPLRSDDGEVCGVSTVVQDVTELKRAQEALRAAGEDLERRVVERTAELDRARETLAHVGRVSMMEELAAGLAHELNQPLTAIANYAGAGLAGLRRSGAAPPELAEDLECIVEQAQRAAGIVRRLRLFVQQGESVRRPTDLRALIADTVSLIAAEARRNTVGLSVNITPELPPCVADAIQVQQVILNLVRNGIDAMPDGASSREIVIDARPAGDQVAVTVRNNGALIPAAHVPRLYDAMFTTRSEGMGLGLAIARTIVDSHGGRLELAHNEPGRVAFRFTLPTTKAGAAHAE